MDEQKEMTKAERAAAVAALGLVYSARFIPQSFSRNAKEKTPSLNWSIRLHHQRGDRVLIETDYGQGIAHQPGYQFGGFASNNFPGRPSPRELDAAFQATAELGTYPTRAYPGGGFARKPLPIPDLVDVLHSLWSDAECVQDGTTFESFAGDLGYDPDSRKAEAIFHACQDIRARLIQMLGRDYAKLAAIFYNF